VPVIRDRIDRAVCALDIAEIIPVSVSPHCKPTGVTTAGIGESAANVEIIGIVQSQRVDNPIHAGAKRRPVPAVPGGNAGSGDPSGTGEISPNVEIPEI